MGQVRMMAKAIANVATSTISEPTKAKPAPGPMYAWASPAASSAAARAKPATCVFARLREGMKLRFSPPGWTGPPLAWFPRGRKNT